MKNMIKDECILETEYFIYDIKDLGLPTQQIGYRSSRLSLEHAKECVKFSPPDGEGFDRYIIQMPVIVMDPEFIFKEERELCLK